MNDLISVIVPVYNIENYIEKCIKSIINQSYKNLEIILIDDGSKDSSGEICDKYAIIDRRIKVIHKNNQGLSAARNTGLDMALGKYVILIDGDDIIKDNMIEILYNLSVENNCDISICRYRSVDETVKAEELKNNGNKSFIVIEDKKELADNEYSYHYVDFTVAWNKLYKKELFKGIYYPLGKVHEDVFTTYKLLYKAKKIIYTRNELYGYVQRNGSIMNQGFSIKRFDTAQGLCEQLDFYIENKEYYLWSKSIFHLKVFLLQAMRMKRSYRKEYKDHIFKYKKIYNDHIKNNLKYSNIREKDKWLYRLFYISPRIYILLAGKGE